MLLCKNNAIIESNENNNQKNISFCIVGTEILNNIDDDCDGIIDEVAASHPHRARAIRNMLPTKNILEQYLNNDIE
jgi:hypothetical protein